MTTRPGILILSVAALALSACNLKPPGDDTGTTDTSGGAIAELQTAGHEDGTEVHLSGVIVTTPFTLEGKGFWIQDPGGGDYSGIYVYLAAGSEGLYLAVGDEIDISATISEFYELTELTVVDNSSITVTGQGEVTADAVDHTAVADWEVYEGNLITISEVEVTGCIDFGEAPVSDDLSIGDDIFDFESEAGATYTSVTGVVNYSYEEWKIYPRTADDLQGYVAGTGTAGTTVSELQQGTGTGCTLEEVVVTAGATAYGNGFFVADQAASTSAYNGIYVYVGSAGVDEAIVPGVTVTMSGSVVEYDGENDGEGDGIAITEFMPDEITVVGTADVPTPVALSSAPADWAPYDGVLLTLEGVEVTNDDAGYGEAETDWDINIDDLFFVFSSTTGTTYDLTGVVNEFYDWKVAPRSQGDLAAK